MENPIKIDDLGVPLFSETSIYIYTYFFDMVLVYALDLTSKHFIHRIFDMYLPMLSNSWL